MQLLIGKKPGDEELKCFLALSLTGTEFSIGAADKKYSSCGPQLAVKPGAELLFSANAVCRFVAANAGQLQSDDLAVDEWIEWEANTLAPWLRVAKAANNKNGELGGQLAAMLEAKEEARPKNSGDLQFLFGSELSLADVVAGVTLRAAFKVAKEEKDEAAVLQTFRKYVTQLFAREDVVKGVASMKNAGKAAKNGKGPPVPPPRSTFKLDVKLEQGLTYHNILEVVESIFDAAIKAAYPGLEIPPVEVTRTNVKNAKFGDYQCNSAMSIFTALKGTPNAARSPRDVANTIIAAMPETRVLDRLTVAGAGFINAFLTKEFVATRLQNVLANGVQPAPQKKQTIVVDFSSPNIAKDMHVGHLRSTIIGTPCPGYDVKRINHVGDWGTQFGMLICHLTETYPTWETEMPNVTDLTKLYKAAKERFDADADFHERSKAQVVLLQSGDENSRKVWETLCEISRREFQKVYDRLGVSLNEMGESFYNPIIPDVLDKLRAKGLVEKSNGAEVVFTKAFKQPFMLVKSDGSYLYDTTDIAALWYRLHEMKADRIIYYTDYTQKDHFSLLFEVGRMSGIYDPTKQRADTWASARVQDALGRDRASGGAAGRGQGAHEGAAVERIEADKRRYPWTRWTLPLRSSATAPSSTSTCVRARRPTTSSASTACCPPTVTRLCISCLRTPVCRRSSASRAWTWLRSWLSSRRRQRTQAGAPTEQALVIELLQLQDVIVFINKDLSSNRLCSYLYTISEKVQTFVTACRVLGSEEQNSRLLLCDATVKVMKTCFRCWASTRWTRSKLVGAHYQSSGSFVQLSVDTTR
ncbi:Rossmann-like alpha/beta/alpha sandwich fold [Phytophthora cactorum]|nr:Rossmann-like alpha/beta/alpha sandwich fold [Phytophthora cactorum]